MAPVNLTYRRARSRSLIRAVRTFARENHQQNVPEMPGCAPGTAVAAVEAALTRDEYVWFCAQDGDKIVAAYCVEPNPQDERFKLYFMKVQLIALINEGYNMEQLYYNMLAAACELLPFPKGERWVAVSPPGEHLDRLADSPFGYSMTIEETRDPNFVIVTGETPPYPTPHVPVEKT